MQTDWFEQKSHLKLLGILGIVAYLLLMCGNSIVSLTHPDEVFYAQSTKEMIAQNSWLTPIMFEEPHFEKPFLSFVFFMLSVKWFGLTSFAARFWPSLFGIIGVGVAYWIAWTLFKRKRISFLSGLILCSSFIYFALARALLTDMIFSVIVTASIGFFCMAYYDRRYKKTGIILWLSVAGMGVLTKGILGIAFPLGAVVLFLIYKKELGFLKDISLLWGLLSFLVITIPWHLIMYMQHGLWFIEEYFYNVHWRRILMSEHARLDNWYFYIALMFVGIMPWFLFWIPAGTGIYMQFKKKMALRDKLFFLLAWIISVYIFVQPAHSKLASYIFPAFPAIAIIIAYFLNDALERAVNRQEPKTLHAAAYLMAVFLFIVSVAAVIFARKYPEIILNLAPIDGAAIAMALLAVCIIILNKKRLFTAMVLSFSCVTVIFFVSLYFSRSYIEPWVSCKAITDAFQKYDQSNDPILSSKFYVRGVRYYTDRPVAVIDVFGKGFWSPHPIPYLNTDNSVIEFLKKRPVTWAIVKDGNVRDLKRILKHQKFKIHELEGIGGKFILKIVRTG